MTINQRANAIVSATDRTRARSAFWVLDQFMNMEKLRMAVGRLVTRRHLERDTTALDEQLQKLWAEMRRIEACLGLARALQLLVQPEEAAAAATWIPSDVLAELDMLAALHQPLPT
jgi:hypothetical protein